MSQRINGIAIINEAINVDLHFDAKCTRLSKLNINGKKRVPISRSRYNHFIV
jgi:hypothetical protein